MNSHINGKLSSGPLIWLAYRFDNLEIHWNIILYSFQGLRVHELFFRVWGQLLWEEVKTNVWKLRVQSKPSCQSQERKREERRGRYIVIQLINQPLWQRSQKIYTAKLFLFLFSSPQRWRVMSRGCICPKNLALPLREYWTPPQSFHNLWPTHSFGGCVNNLGCPHM